jgi:hypothetical protein
MGIMAKARLTRDALPPPPPQHRGSQLWSTKLSEEEVLRIRQMHAAGWTVSALARQYKTTWVTMSRIVAGKSWRHVPMV